MSQPVKTKIASAVSPEKQLAGFIAKFEPKYAKLIRECRAELRSLLPATFELVYDNYNFFVIGYCTTPRSSDCIVSIAAAANGVLLSFYYGATLPDPEKILQGSGKQNRFIRIGDAGILRQPAVVALIHSAAGMAKTPLPKTGGGELVIQSISAKQRPRRKLAAKTPVKRP